MDAINNAVNYYYQPKWGYNEDQYSSKEFMINLASKHDKIKLDAGCLLFNSISEKRGELVSKGWLLKVENYIFNKNLQEIKLHVSGLCKISKTITEEEIFNSYFISDLKSCISFLA